MVALFTPVLLLRVSLTGRFVNSGSHRRCSRTPAPALTVSVAVSGCKPERSVPVCVARFSLYASPPVTRRCSNDQAPLEYPPPQPSRASAPGRDASAPLSDDATDAL